MGHAVLEGSRRVVEILETLQTSRPPQFLIVDDDWATTMIPLSFAIEPMDAKPGDVEGSTPRSLARGLAPPTPGALARGLTPPVAPNSPGNLASLSPLLLPSHRLSQQRKTKGGPRSVRYGQ